MPLGICSFLDKDPVSVPFIKFWVSYLMNFEKEKRKRKRGIDRYWFRLTFSVLFILAHISYSFLHYCFYSSECYSSFHCYTFSSSPEGEYIYGTLLCLLVYIRTWHSQFTVILLLLLVVNTSFMIDPVSFISHLASVSSGLSLTARTIPNMVSEVVTSVQQS